jgi:hypothetical protein
MKSVLALPPNTLLEFLVELLLADSAMRPAPTEGAGNEMTENVKLENQPTLPTDASHSNASVARTRGGHL